MSGDADDELVRTCSDLIRIDSTNTGDPATSKERAAAEYVAEQLAEVGLEPTVLESAPGRTSVVARMSAAAGTDRPALLYHAHLDVVPADAQEWSVHPLSGEVRDGYVWGRGAVDMKDVDAMLLSVVRAMRREGRAPARDLVLAFVADEEAGGAYGAQWLVEHHPGLFEGCTEAVGEVGGFSFTVGPDLRLYLVQIAEKGLIWLRLHAKGRPGHGSMVHDDNAVTALAEAVARVGRHRFPVRLTGPARDFLVELGDALGFEVDLEAPEAALAKLGTIAPIIGSTLRNTANPTRLAAGYKENVIPSRASATIDCRTLPGEHESFLDQLREVVGDEIDIEVVERLPPVQTSFDGPLVAAMTAALRAEDPGARPLPYMLSGGTDAKSFATLGMRCFGFTPLRLPPELNFAALFHGIDERVPIDGLRFGARVLDRLFATA
ncbi:MAG TPA: M20/M25/M40 family metallo-hydrolase [Micromonosporaceae bacterium]|jgi:acetylornithine deacetylase/succinyl-diaminopimelate desuccinylase-like protein